MTENCYLIVGLGRSLDVHVLIPVIRFRDKPLWYALWSAEFMGSQEVVDTIYSETIFTKEGEIKDGKAFKVSVSGKLKSNLDFPGLFSPNFSHPEPSFLFHLYKVTVPQPVHLPVAARISLIVCEWFPLVLPGLCFLAFLFFLYKCAS